MEDASSAMKKLESDFDSVFGPDKLGSESPLGPATSDQRHVSQECTDKGCTEPKRKRQELGPRGKTFRFSGEWIISSNDFECLQGLSFSGSC